jgi:hypothetical protein
MTRKISLLLALSLLLAVSCWRRQKTGEAPKLPQPPKTGAKASTGYQGLDRYGFFFVIFTETGRHFVQLSEWVDKEPAEVPNEKIQIAQIVPTLVLLHSPEAAIFPELEGREYVVMRNHEPICRGKMEAPLLVGQQVPGSHEWNEWDVEPWDNPRPQLEEVAKKVPLSEMWKKSYVFSGGPLSSCTVARKDGDYDKVFWARPADLPSPSLLSQDISKEMYQQLHEEAVRRLKVGGFRKNCGSTGKTWGRTISNRTSMYPYGRMRSRYSWKYGRRRVRRNAAGPPTRRGLYGR